MSQLCKRVLYMSVIIKFNYVRLCSKCICDKKFDWLRVNGVSENLDRWNRVDWPVNDRFIFLRCSMHFIKIIIRNKSMLYGSMCCLTHKYKEYRRPISYGRTSQNTKWCSAKYLVTKLPDEGICVPWVQNGGINSL